MNRPAQATICIPTLDRPVAVRKAIASALSNSSPDIGVKIIVSVNGASEKFREDYKALAREFSDSVTFIIREERSLPEVHFRQLMAAVDTEYLAMLADDDWHALGFVDRAVALANQTGAALVFGPYQITHRDRLVQVDEDYSSSSALARAIKFAWRNEDGCFYGLFRTSVLKRNLEYLDVYTILGVRTPVHAVYPVLLATIIDGGFASVSGQDGPIWFNDETTIKHEPGVQRSHALRSLGLMTLAKWARLCRYLDIVREKLGWRAVSLFAIPGFVRFAREIARLWLETGVSFVRRRLLAGGAPG